MVSTKAHGGIGHSRAKKQHTSRLGPTLHGPRNGPHEAPDLNPKVRGVAAMGRESVDPGGVNGLSEYPQAPERADASTLEGALQSWRWFICCYIVNRARRGS